MAVQVTVDVFADGPRRPPLGSIVRVEVRDTSLADAPSRTVASAEGRVHESPSGTIETLELSVGELPTHATVWVLVDVDGDGRASRGDFVTVASHPVPRDPQPRLAVTVKPI
jgi:hypothetical protein